MISEANCYLNGLKVACSTSSSRDFQTWASTGFAIFGNNENVGALELKFDGEIGSSTVEIEYTREDQWDKSCDVELLKNGKVIDSVPDNQGDSRNDRTKSSTPIVTGDTLTLREGGDGSICGVHIYEIKIHCNGKIILNAEYEKLCKTFFSSPTINKLFHIKKIISISNRRQYCISKTCNFKFDWLG